MPSEREQMLAGELYDPFDPELVAARERARDLCQALNAPREGAADARRAILRELVGRGGDTVWMPPPCCCDYAFLMNATQRYVDSQGLLPFHTTVQNERLFIRRDLSEGDLGVGSEILAIDGIASNVILRRIEPFLGVDGGSLSGLYFRLGSNYNSFYRVFPLIFGVQPHHVVVVRDARTRMVREVAVTPVSGGAFGRLERERYGSVLHIQSLDEELALPPLQLRLEKESGYAVLKIRRFFKDGYNEPLDAYPALYRDAFQQVAESGAGTLIVDIRSHGGGIGANAAHLVRYLSDSTFVPTRAMTFRGNDAYYTKVTSDDLQLDAYFGLRREGDLYAVTATDKLVELQSFTPVTAGRFRGQLIVLIDGGTVSAAGMAAGLLQQYTNAIIVGQEAGGYAGMSNGLRQLTVRGLHTDSGINFPLSHSEFSVSSQRPSRGVVPDHAVSESVDDIRSGRDAGLQFALSLAR